MTDTTDAPNHCLFFDAKGNGPSAVRLIDREVRELVEDGAVVVPRAFGLCWEVTGQLHFVEDGGFMLDAGGVTWLRDKLTAWLDAPRLAAPSSPRFFRISTDGSTPTWTIIADSPSAAWRMWVEHEERSGYLDGDACSTAAADVPSFFLVELTDAASRIVDDDGTRRPLSECAIGSVFCSEY